MLSSIDMSTQEIALYGRRAGIYLYLVLLFKGVETTLELAAESFGTSLIGRLGNPCGRFPTALLCSGQTKSRSYSHLEGESLILVEEKQILTSKCLTV